MSRVVIALFTAPLIGSLVFGQFFFLAYQFMLLITLLGAVPLLLILYKFKCLNWWHAVIAGGLFGLCFAVFITHDIDELLSRNNILHIGIGVLTAFIFWWAGIFRNSRFEFVSRSFPISSLLLIPIALGGVLLHQFLKTEFYEGRVQSIIDENPYPIPSDQCVATVRLSSGEEVEADFWGCDWTREGVINKCFHLRKHWSTLRFRYVYDISSKFGGEGNNC